MQLKTSFLAGTAFGLSCTLVCFAAEPVSIAEVAPRDTFVVISVPNWQVMRQNFDKTAAAKIWKDPATQKCIDDLLDERKKEDPGFNDFLDKWHETMKELDEPTGAVGLAVHLAEAPKPAQNADDTMPPPGKVPQVLLLSDFGANAEKVETKIMSLMEEGQKDGELKLDERKVGSVTVHIVTSVEKPKEKPAPVDVDGDGEDDIDYSDFEDDSMSHLETMQFARVGNVLLLGSHIGTFDNAIEKIETGKGESLADDKSYIATLAQHPKDSHAFAAFVMSTGLRDQIVSGLDAMSQGMGTGLDPKKILDTIGISSFQSISMGVQFNTERADSEQTISVLVPEKKGLFTLLDTESSAFVPPAFVGAETTTLNKFVFRFDKLFDVARSIVATMPEEARQEAMSGIQGVESQVGPAFKALGPEIYQIQSIDKPLSVTSQKSVVAIKCTDELAVNNAIVGFAGMMGLEARDFQGFQIYDNQMAQMAIGIGAGYVFSGNPESVENALRTAAQPGDSRLANDARFKAATGTLRDEGNIYSYSATRETMEYAYWQLQNMDKMLKAQFAAMGMDAEDMDESMYAEAIPAWAKKLPPIEGITKYLGDAVSSFKPTPDGFRGHSMMLRPAAGK